MESELNKTIRELLEGYGIAENFKLIGDIKRLIEKTTPTQSVDENTIRGFYEFIKQGEYFDEKNLEQIENEIELYIVRNFPTKTQSVSEESIIDFHILAFVGKLKSFFTHYAFGEEKEVLNKEEVFEEIDSCVDDYLERYDNQPNKEQEDK
jgi:hypothetical protein